MDESNRLKKIILDKSFERRKVVLASGRESNFYFDGKQTSLHPEGAYLVGTLMYQLIMSKFPMAKAIGGPTLGADPIATAVAIASHLSLTQTLPAFIIRKEPKKHGTGAWIEGIKNLEPQFPVVIVEDVITTGGSVKFAIQKALESNLRVIGVCVIVDREEGGREDLESEFGIPVLSLYTKSDLMND